MPPSLDIPSAGLKLESHLHSTKSAGPATPAIGLTLSDGMIDAMIKCVQDGKPIELSLGASPTLIYGNKSHNLSTYEDPFHHELYQTRDTTKTSNNTSNKMSGNWLYQAFFLKNHFVPTGQKPRYKYVDLKTGKTTRVEEPEPTRVGGDAALANLKHSMASEKAKKEGNTIKYVKEGLPVPGKRGGGPAKVTSKSKFLSQNRGLNSDAARSLPVSPALSGVGSPALGPTSKSLSQQQAELAKSARKPIIHLLALEPMSEKNLHDRIATGKDDFQQALAKVADVNDSTKKWELRKNYYKELDVFTFDYDSDKERQRVIDNAIKIFDKMRLGTSEPQWDKLLPKAERGTGKCLSKLQAQIAQGPIVKAKSKDSNRNSPVDGDEDLFGDKNTSKSKGEATAKSTPQATAAKPKKITEKEAQAKRLLSKNPAKAAAAASKPKPAKSAAKPAAKPVSKPLAKNETDKSKAAARPLSNQFVSDSDEEEVESKKQPVKKPVKKASNKRLREEEEADSSDSSLPLSKKSKVTNNNNNTNNHRISDASQSSRPSSNSTSSSANSFKGKANSPQKSSPLASSPPTNASELGNNSGSDRTSSSASPAHRTTYNGRSPIHKRHQKSSSVTSSNSSSSSSVTRYLKPNVLDAAKKFKTYYPKYVELHRELSNSRLRDTNKERDLLDMHERLARWKSAINGGIVEV